MKVTRAQADEHRRVLLEQGGRLLRRRGIAGVSIADIARAAGLTHGAFYGHFESKTALVAESVAASLAAAARRWRDRAAGPDGLEAIIAAYLTPRHRDAPEGGCALAALGPELARADPSLAAALHAGTAALLAVLDDLLARRHPALPAPPRRARALAILSAMTGGLAIARALAADPEASAAALHEAARLSLAAADLPDS
ncbi:MAG: TetR family transcriptional regulator [Acetobacteraceae bacterium]|nr:TetR family transcriptional regulator [Acetobacteraceae bacterium]